MENKLQKLKLILEKHASHMNNLIASASCCAAGLEGYEEIPEHVVKSLFDLEKMWFELDSLVWTKLDKAIEK